MALWIDKNRPSTLSKLSLHHDITAKLSALANTDEIPHLLFYGPPGAGKKTRVMALLREIYGAGVERIKLEHRTFKNNSGKSIEISTLGNFSSTTCNKSSLIFYFVGSNYHIECNPSDAGNNDRLVIQEVIKEIASHGNLAAAGGGSRSFKIGIFSTSAVE
jgi:replication factor C subunit 3/5